MRGRGEGSSQGGQTTHRRRPRQWRPLSSRCHLRGIMIAIVIQNCSEKTAFTIRLACIADPDRVMYWLEQVQAERSLKHKWMRRLQRAEHQVPRIDPTASTPAVYP